MQPTLLFYDYETFGKNPSLDRPAQFAALRTDINLNPVGDPKVIYCQPALDYLPQAEAVLITGITPQIACERGINEAQFTKQIYKIFNIPNTCVIGYNNLCFDDEISRNLFYRNFYDPYSWSWKNKNSRWDLLNVIRTCYALRPQGIQWPLDLDGLPSLRLTELTQKNGIVHHHAHDAIDDVYATIELAKLIKKKQPRLYHFLYHYRNKAQLNTLINIREIQILVHVSNTFGKKRKYTSLIAPLGWHPKKQNTLIVCDLSKNIAPLFETNSNELRTKLYRCHKHYDEISTMPLKLIHLNRCPVIAPAHTLRDFDAQRINIDIKDCLNNFKKLQQHPQISKKIIELYLEEPPILQLNDVDAQLYNGFFNQTDQSSIKIIRNTNPETLSSLRLSFHDERLSKLLFRFRARNFPETLNTIEKKIWMAQRRSILTQKYFNQYIEKIHTLLDLNKCNQNKMKILEDLLSYAKELQWYIHSDSYSI
ncbi:Exodeoxyribonuclease I [Candidatus Erwinia haradaeae]|uniref:Exodeoxyribonuclease I n=2 Tax=Candidatus Erwinia haradaeae TaxID=1922217 RepID=A0A451CZG1_9GAMM|nr:Exodeoxyribonuclease I [Candidatus Erwinia haradaeae]